MVKVYCQTQDKLGQSALKNQSDMEGPNRGKENARTLFPKALE